MTVPRKCSVAGCDWESRARGNEWKTSSRGRAISSTSTARTIQRSDHMLPDLEAVQHGGLD